MQINGFHNPHLNHNIPGKLADSEKRDLDDNAVRAAL